MRIELSLKLTDRSAFLESRVWEWPVGHLVNPCVGQVGFPELSAPVNLIPPTPHTKAGVDLWPFVPRGWAATWSEQSRGSFLMTLLGRGNCIQVIFIHLHLGGVQLPGTVTKLYRCPGDKKWTRSSLRSLVDGSSFLGETTTIQRAKFYNHGKCQTHRGVKRMCSDSVTRMTSQREVCLASEGVKRRWGSRRFQGVFLAPSTVTQDSEQVLLLLLLLQCGF